MYNNDDTKWFSQSLFYHKDKTEGTDSSLKISISTGSSDLANFNIPKLSLQIQNHLHKTANMDLHEVRDVLLGIRECLKRDNPLDGEPVIRRLAWNNEISISFHHPSDPKVKITLRSSESDLVSSIVPFSKFKTILKIMNQFVEKYIVIADGLVLRAISYQLGRLDDLNRNIRGLYSIQETRQTPESTPPDRADAQSNNALNSASESLNKNLDEFLGKDMGNISIPEIEKAEKPKKQQTAIESKFVDVLLKGDFENFINLIDRTTSIDNLVSQLSSLDFYVLPGIEDKEYTLMTYFTKLFVDLHISNCIQNSAALSPGFPIIKYNAKNIEKENIDLAYDLLLLSVYTRMFRRKIESNNSDIYENHSIHHLKTRMFTDPMIFPFVAELDNNKVLSAVMNRFEYYRSIGFFKWSDKHLKSYNYPEITDKEVSDFLNEVLKKAKESKLFMDYFEDARKNSNLRLPVDNNLKLEQIKNELIPLEIKEKISGGVTEEDLKDVSDEVKFLFSTKNPRQPKTMNPIEMFIKKMNVKFSDNDMFEKVMTYVKDFGDKKIDFDNFPVEIEDLEEEVLQGLYYWDPEKHRTVTPLMRELENANEKNLIIARLKNKNDTIKQEDGLGMNFEEALGNLEL